MRRCEDNFHYLKITVTSISSSVNIEKRRSLCYEKQVSVLELLVARDIHLLSATYIFFFGRFFEPTMFCQEAKFHPAITQGVQRQLAQDLYNSLKFALQTPHHKG